MFRYYYALPDGREISVRAERSTEAAQLVAANFDGGDFAREVRIEDDLPARAPCLLCGAPVAVTATHAAAHWIPALCPDMRCRDRMPEAERLRTLAEARAAIERGTALSEAYDAVERLA